MRKRLFALLVAVLMVVGIVPATGTISYAAEEDIIINVEKNVADKLNDIDINEHNMKIANPDDLGLTGDERNWFFSYGFGGYGQAAEFGIDRGVVSNEGSYMYSYDLWPVYYDVETNIEVEHSNLKPNTKYYLEFTYIGDILINGNWTSSTVRSDNRILWSYSIVDVSKYEKEIQKINSNKELGPVEIYYDDLSWINILAFAGEEPELPVINHTDSMLKEQNPEIYNKMIADTKLDLVVVCGGSGDATHFSKDIVGTVLYYVEDDNEGNIYFGNGSEAFIFMVNAMYIADSENNENTAEIRAKAAEKRIKKYMGAENYKVTVDALDSKGLAEFAQKLYESNYGNDTYAYMTRYGIAFYNDPQNTSKDNYLGMIDFVENPVFDNGNLLSCGTLNYIDTAAGENRYPEYNVNSYNAYKLTLSNKANKAAQEYLFLIGTKPEAELNYPYANWKDADTGIITEGENGQIVTDFYTKIRKVGNDEIKIITKKVNGKNVKAFDINAFTNFKDENITDLGDGVVKVMIPIESFGEENLKAFYYDKDGNVQYIPDEDYLGIEEHDGIKYVCFRVHHFSTYGIVSDGATGNTGAGAGSSGSSSNNYTSASTPSSTQTGDESNMLIPLLVMLTALVAMGTAVAVRRKHN